MIHLISGKLKWLTKTKLIMNSWTERNEPKTLKDDEMLENLMGIWISTT